MAVDFRLLGQGFDAMEALNYAGQARQRSMAEQQLQQQQQTRQQAISQYQAGDTAGAQTTALAGGMDDLAKHLSGLDDAGRKAAVDQMKQLGELALLADTPEKWDAYATQYVQQGHPEAQAFIGQYSPAARAALIAQAGKASEFISQNEPKWQSIGEGGIVNVRDPQAIAAYQGQQPQQAPAGDLNAMARAAIAAGADPAAVRARMQQMSGGAAPQGAGTFP